MNLKLTDLFLFSIPEAIIIVLLALSMFEQKLQWRRLVLMGVILGSTSYLTRQMTGSYILNVLISIVVLTGILRIFNSKDIFQTASVSLISVSLYLTVEFLNVKTIPLFSGLAPIQMEQDLPLRILWFIPQIIAGTMLAWIIRCFIFRQPPGFSSRKDML